LWGSAAHPQTALELEKNKMLPLVSFESLLEHVSHRLWRNPDDKETPRIRLVGIVFAPPNEPLARDEILPQLGSWHAHTGRTLDFFFAGYELRGHADSRTKYRDVEIPGDLEWCYSDDVFHSIRSGLQQRTKWQFSGASELLLTNAEWMPDEGRAKVDFSSTMVCRLAEMKRQGAIGSVGEFVTSIFNSVERVDRNDPTWGFSKKHARDVAGNVIKHFVMSLLPTEFATDLKNASHFVVADVGRRVA
jgi:hypothetical protein